MNLLLARGRRLKAGERQRAPRVPHAGASAGSGKRKIFGRRRHFSVGRAAAHRPPLVSASPARALVTGSATSRGPMDAHPQAQASLSAATTSRSCATACDDPERGMPLETWGYLGARQQVQRDCHESE